MIVVIDYNIGNVRSVCKAFSHIGCDVKLSRDAGDIDTASALVLPGVAAFGYAIEALGDAAELVKDAAGRAKPLLGICVGYQLLFAKSSEYGQYAGLGLVEGEVIPIPPGRVIPHMGWNKVKASAGMDLFAGMDENKHFYFAHSYYAKVADAQAKVAYTDYGFDLPAAVQKQNIYGTQFHPEKSGPAGLQVLKNFARIAGEKSD